MKKYMISICIIFFISHLKGQQRQSITDFLTDADQQESVSFQKQKINRMERLNYDLPIIEKLEFRTETNEFDLKKQEYLLRISPNSFGKINTNRQYQQTIKNMNDMELEEARSNAIMQRYDLIINYILSNEILNALRRQQILFNDKVTLFKRSSTLPNFDVMDLIESEDEAQENLRNILDIENEINTLKMIIEKNNNEQEVNIEKENLITVNDVRLHLNDLNHEEQLNHPTLEVLSARTYMRMLEYEWETAKSNFSLGYIQAKYGYEPEDPFKKNFSIGIGFDIPLKNSGRLELNELEIDIMESESQFREMKNKMIESRYSLYQQLQNLISKYTLVTDQLEVSQAEFALKEYSKLAEASPKALLKLRENTLKKEVLLHELEKEIISKYIGYLNLHGLLSKFPFKNYLLKADGME